MRWSEPADRRVVESVIAAFTDSAECLKQRLTTLRHRDWLRSYNWLDASGLALYFLDRLYTLELDGALPASVVGRLRQNLRDNGGRNASMMREFRTINRSFLECHIEFCNLKGFTLSPESCHNPNLRSQLDFDFLVNGRDLELCQEILTKTGYVRTAANPTVWEFKAGNSELARLEDHYKPRPQRSVELHFAANRSAGTPARDIRLERLAWRAWGDEKFPVLSGPDVFVGQALHLLAHLRSASTRPSWLLEYKNHLTARYDDQSFWESVQERSRSFSDAPVAIGLATLLATQLFGGSAPTVLDCWTLDCLPPSVRLWAERYGRKAVLADFPGTKLYLLLEEQLNRGNAVTRKQNRARLLPRRPAPRIISAAPNERLSGRLRRTYYQARFVLFRLRFHAVEGVRYWIESWRWMRTISRERGVPLQVATEPARRSRA